MAENSDIRATVSQLVAVMKQRESFETLPETDTVVVLRTLLGAVINDSCDYVSSVNNQVTVLTHQAWPTYNNHCLILLQLNERFDLHLECTAVEVEELYNRLLLVNTLFDVSRTLLFGNFNFGSEGDGYRYDYWNSKVTSDCGSVQNSHCSSLQSVASNVLNFANSCPQC